MIKQSPGRHAYYEAAVNLRQAVRGRLDSVDLQYRPKLSDSVSMRFELRSDPFNGFTVNYNVLALIATFYTGLSQLSWDIDEQELLAAVRTHEFRVDDATVHCLITLMQTAEDCFESFTPEVTPHALLMVRELITQHLVERLAAFAPEGAGVISPAPEYAAVLVQPIVEDILDKFDCSLEVDVQGRSA